MRFAKPAIIPIKTIKVIFALNWFKINKPRIDRIATLLAAKIWPLKYFEICCSILYIVLNPTSKYLFGRNLTNVLLKS